jgi:hypothetical protein
MLYKSYNWANPYDPKLHSFAVKIYRTPDILPKQPKQQ